jgi:hypothetical protein
MPDSTAVSSASRIRAALAAVLVRAHAPELEIVHRWLDTWSGLGAPVLAAAPE